MAKDDIQLAKVLHEPLAPYLASVYNNLTHLVQGLVLAALFYMISIQEQITLPIALNLIICFGFVVVIWHTFIVHNQYIVIRASIFDTLLPIVLSVCQCALALTVNQPIYIFTLLIFPIFITLELIILNAYVKNKDPLALEIFKERYKELGSQFTQDFYDELRKFEKITTQRKVPALLIILGLLTVFNYSSSINSEMKTYISFIIIGIFLFLMGYLDLNKILNRSQLRDYGYKW